MHLPDGILSGHVSAVTAVVGASGFGYTLLQAVRERTTGLATRAGFVGAFIFFAQMIHFPVFAGASGHLMGAALAAALLGPWLAVVVMTGVLAVQSFLFGDGGVTALGANVLTMALIAVTVSWTIQRLNPGSRAFIALSAWAGVFAASGVCTLQLSFSGVASAPLIASAMLGAHALIGVGEAVITLLVIALVEERPGAVVFKPAAASEVR